jgi:hypothetical protein
MNTSILVEGSFGLRFLNLVLADLDETYSFKVEGRKSQDAVRPWARKKLVTTRDPVALVVNSDTNDETRIRQQRRELEYYLDWVAGPTPYKVIQFVPAMEAVLFQTPDVLQKIAIGRPLHREVATAGRYAPRQILDAMGLGQDQILKALDASDFERLRKHKHVRELREFIQSPTMIETTN